jgi:hypothetical protein
MSGIFRKVTFRCSWNKASTCAPPLLFIVEHFQPIPSKTINWVFALVVEQLN